MYENEMQDDFEIIDEEELIDFFDDSPYYHDEAYPEFNGWRDLVW